MKHDQKPLTLLQVNDFYTNGKRIKLDPKYQRNDVWSKSQKQKLIQSLIMGYGTQKFLFREVPRENDVAEFEVVDGQQRFRTIIEYFNSEFAIPKELENSSHPKLAQYAGLKYNKLPSGLIQDFGAINIDVVYVSDASDNDIRELFLMWNNGTPLRGMELISPKGGPLIDAVETIYNSYYDTIFGHNKGKTQQKGIVKNNANDRGQFNLTIAKLIASFLRGSATKTSFQRITHKLVIQHVDECNKTNSIDKTKINRLKKSLDYLNISIVPELKTATLPTYLANSTFLAAPNSKTPRILLPKAVFIALVQVTDHILQTYVAPNPTEYVTAIYKFLADLKDRGPLHDTYMELRDSAEVIQKDRFDNMLKYIVKYVGLTKRDTKRTFANKDRQFVFDAHNGICVECKTDCNYVEWHIDHIVPHSKGGQTTLSNAQLLCAECNLNKGSLLLAEA